MSKSVAPQMPQAGRLDPRVIHEDAAVIVIDKPAGLVVHPAPTERQPGASVVAWLQEHYPEMRTFEGRGIGDDPDRPGVVHRLDRETSGLMVIARTPEAFAKLKAAFKAREVSKLYQVLVEGAVPWQNKRVELAIRRTGSGLFGARHPHDVAELLKKRPDASRSGDRSMPAPQYREAVTEFTVKKRFVAHAEGSAPQTGTKTLLEARPLTGRTHQIRVHLKALGYPVVGDALYAPKKSLAAVRAAGLTRHFLHAAQLSFVHPVTGKPVTFTTPLPQELSNYVMSLDEHTY